MVIKESKNNHKGDSHFQGTEILSNEKELDDKIKYKELLAHDYESLSRTLDVRPVSSPNDEDINYSNFEHLMLSQETTQGLLKCGFNFLTPIQLKSIPMGRLGLDMILQSKAGTGKTCVFAVIALESIDMSIDIPQVLVLVPTKEVAFQIRTALHNIGQGYKNLNIACLVGGFKIKPLNETPMHTRKLYDSHIIVGTPSRIKHLIYLKLLNIQSVKLLVMDEADQLFRVKDDEETINWIYSSLPLMKQVTSTSATYSDDLVKLLRDKYMKDPQIIRIEKDDIQLIGVKQYIKDLDGVQDPNEFQDGDVVGDSHPPNFLVNRSKLSFLVAFLNRVTFTRCFVFCNQNKDLPMISNVLKGAGISSYRSLCSKQTIQNRLHTLKSFRAGHFKILLTTDVLSRGIDVKGVDLVVNYELPFSPDKYVHRIGRCGRFGTYGVALTLLSSQVQRHLFNNYFTMYDLDVAILPSPLRELPIDFVTNQESYATAQDQNGKPVGAKAYLRSVRPDIQEMAYLDHDLMLSLDTELIVLSRTPAICQNGFDQERQTDGHTDGLPSPVNHSFPPVKVCSTSPLDVGQMVSASETKSRLKPDRNIPLGDVKDGLVHAKIDSHDRVKGACSGGKVKGASPRALVSYEEIPTTPEDQLLEEGATNKRLNCIYASTQRQKTKTGREDGRRRVGSRTTKKMDAATENVAEGNAYPDCMIPKPISNGLSHFDVAKESRLLNGKFCDIYPPISYVEEETYIPPSSVEKGSTHGQGIEIYGLTTTRLTRVSHPNIAKESRREIISDRRTPDYVNKGHAFPSSTDEIDIPGRRFEVGEDTTPNYIAPSRPIVVTSVFTKLPRDVTQGISEYNEARLYTSLVRGEKCYERSMVDRVKFILPLAVKIATVIYTRCLVTVAITVLPKDSYCFPSIKHINKNNCKPRSRPCGDVLTQTIPLEKVVSPARTIVALDTTNGTRSSNSATQTLNNCDSSDDTNTLLNKHFVPRLRSTCSAKSQNMRCHKANNGRENCCTGQSSSHSIHSSKADNSGTFPTLVDRRTIYTTRGDSEDSGQESTLVVESRPRLSGQKFQKLARRRRSNKSSLHYSEPHTGNVKFPEDWEEGQVTKRQRPHPEISSFTRTFLNWESLLTLKPTCHNCRYNSTGILNSRGSTCGYCKCRCLQRTRARYPSYLPPPIFMLPNPSWPTNYGGRGYYSYC